MRKDAAAGIGCCGTWEYMGPEAWCRLYGLPGLHSDTFAFGIILWEIYAAARPYTGLPGSPHLTMRKVRADDGQEHDDMTVVPAWYAKGKVCIKAHALTRILQSFYDGLHALHRLLSFLGPLLPLLAVLVRSTLLSQHFLVDLALAIGNRRRIGQCIEPLVGRFVDVRIGSNQCLYCLE
eukprot:COSAG01_NODE_28317_length_664_cov_0.548673_1_plen_179_part_00